MAHAAFNPTLTPLSDHLGVEVGGIDLTKVTTQEQFQQIRDLFDTHSALLFRNQALTEDVHIRLSSFFGPIEDRMADERKAGETFKVPEVSNVRADGTVSEDMDLHTLNLKSNFLWHSDSTFLPTPALVNVITVSYTHLTLPTNLSV